MSENLSDDGFPPVIASQTDNMNEKQGEAYLEIGKKSEGEDAVNSDEDEEKELVAKIQEKLQITPSCKKKAWSRKTPIDEDSIEAEKDKTIEKFSKLVLGSCASSSVDDQNISMEAETEQNVTLRISYLAKVSNITVGQNEKFSSIISKVADLFKLKIAEVVLCLREEIISFDETPSSLNVKAWEIIDCLPYKSVKKIHDEVASTKILIRFQSNDCKKKYELHAHKLEKFQGVMERYANLRKLPLKDLTFEFDGDKISESDTPDGLDMEDKSIVDVKVIGSSLKPLVNPAFDSDILPIPRLRIKKEIQSLKDVVTIPFIILKKDIEPIGHACSFPHMRTFGDQPLKRSRKSPFDEDTNEAKKDKTTEKLNKRVFSWGVSRSVDDQNISMEVEKEQNVTLRIIYLGIVSNITMGQNEKFSSIKSIVADCFELKIADVVLYLRDKIISFDETPSSLNIKEWERIDVMPIPGIRIKKEFEPLEDAYSFPHMRTFGDQPLKRSHRGRKKPLDEDIKKKDKKIEKLNKFVLRSCASSSVDDQNISMEVETEQNVTLRINYKGRVYNFTVGPNEKFSSIISKVTDPFKLKMEDAVLCLRDKIISFDETPSSLNVKAWQVIDMFKKNREKVPIKPRSRKKAYRRRYKPVITLQDGDYYIDKVDPNKILIRLQSNDCKKKYKLYAHKFEKFQGVMERFAYLRQLPLRDLIFEFDGEKISASDTPDGLNMEDESIVDVTVFPSSLKRGFPLVISLESDEEKPPHYLWEEDPSHYMWEEEPPYNMWDIIVLD